MDTLSGSVSGIVYYNAENGYCVLRIKVEGHKPLLMGDRDEVVVVGNLPQLTPGETVRFQGQWTRHAKHGWQFQSEYCEQILPATIEGIRRYLGSGLIKGIGQALAKRIVDTFGAQTLEILDNQPQRLLEAPDIGKHRLQKIMEAWQEQKQIKEVMLFLHSHGISTNLAVKIFKQYGEQALTVVQNDPYRLAQDIYGVGFKTADKLAQSLGLPVDHPSRIEAGILYTLNTMSEDGHVYAPQPLLVEKTAELLGVPAELIPPALERLTKNGKCFIDSAALSVAIGTQKPAMVSENKAMYGTPACYLAPFYYSENGIAQCLSSLARAESLQFDSASLKKGITDIPLTDEQENAVRTALRYPISILTGGPGTGKTTCLKALIQILERQRKTCAFVAPTGRAAKRLADATGRPASTIHRLLGYSPKEGFKYHASHPLPIDFLVVDEVSMLDMVLAYALFRAIKPGTHILLVGDVDQLPSVGAGDVLRDIIDSGRFPMTKLTRIFRQGEGSQIITNAHRINHGEIPIFSNGEDAQADFFLFPAETAEEAGKWVEEVVCRRIPTRFGLDPRQQVQVLSPMYKGEAGVHALNSRLQSVLNPPSKLKAEKILFGQLFRTGDKVMQMQNNYDKNVYNGDIGWIKGFNPQENTLTVVFDGRAVVYDWSEVDQLTLAYAVSVHKAQGSEFPAVVMPILTAHYMMLQRNLLYTAVTRAQKLCVLIGNKRAIGIAVRNDKVAQRFTALDWRLRIELGND